MSGMNAMAELKERTTGQHQAIEAVVPLMDPRLTLPEYAAYLARVFPFYRAVESQLDQVPGLRNVVDDLDDRWKLRLLARDLRALEWMPPQSIEKGFVPDIGGIAQALGCLYVLEGSTLGSQILLRAVREKFGDAAEGRTSFLAGYGSETGAKWRRLGEILNAALNTGGAREEAVQTACTTFAGLRGWLEKNAQQEGRRTRSAGEPSAG